MVCKQLWLYFLKMFFFISMRNNELLRGKNRLSTLITAKKIRQILNHFYRELLPIPFEKSTENKCLHSGAHTVLSRINGQSRRGTVIDDGFTVLSSLTLILDSAYLPLASLTICEYVLYFFIRIWILFRLPICRTCFLN